MRWLFMFVMTRTLALLCRVAGWDIALALDEEDRVINMFMGPADQVSKYVKDAEAAEK